MTYGTATLVKFGKGGLCVNVPKNVMENENLEAGCVVQFEMTKLKNIPPRKAVHGKRPESPKPDTEAEFPDL